MMHVDYISNIKREYKLSGDNHELNIIYYRLV